MQHVHDALQGTLLVEGKVSYCFALADGQQIKGHDLIEPLVKAFVKLSA